MTDRGNHFEDSEYHSITWNISLKGLVMHYLEAFSQHSSVVLDFINRFSLNFLYYSATLIHVLIIIFNECLFHAKTSSRYTGL